MAAMGGRVCTMLQYIVIFSSVVCLTLGSESYFITHTPDHVKFLPTSSQIGLNEIPDVITSTYGLAPSQDVSWNGLVEGSLFKRPKASVLMSVEGLPGDLEVDNVAKFPASARDGFLDTMPVVASLHRNPYPSRPLIVDFSMDNTAFDIKSEHPQMFRDISPTLQRVKQVLEAGNSPLVGLGVGVLNVSKDSDLTLLAELQLVSEIVTALQRNPELVQDLTPDFFHFRLQGLGPLVKEYGSESSQLQDAKQLLQNFIKKMTSDMRNLYNSNVVVQVVTLPEVNNMPHVRRARSILAANEKNNSIPSNLAPQYDENYPVIFNIILWMMVFLVIAIIAISFGIWHMDPGRDSIIYRMTSQRMKKD